MSKKMLPPVRTQGDGMEREETPGSLLEAKCTQSVNLGTSTNASCVTSPHMPKEAALLMPYNVAKTKENLVPNTKNKEPKFVPYEPYKAAVKPIIPLHKKRSVTTKKSYPDKIPVEKLKDEISTAGESEINPMIEKEESLLCGCEETQEVDSEWEEERTQLNKEIQTLKAENEQLENQLKFQVQVNGELKNLLVAAVGEDMETKVHVLTEDKLHLARALLTSAKSLSTHQEQIEWLAGQCEVWRSKFLASSVMVEELAKWKAGLCQKVSKVHDLLKNLSDEHTRVRTNVLNTYNNLCYLRDNFDLVNRRNELKTSNILELSHASEKTSDILVLQLLGCDVRPYINVEGLCDKTQLELQVDQVLSNPHSLHLVGDPDIACNAVVGAAVALSGKLFLEHHPPALGCCAHCTGETKLI